MYGVRALSCEPGGLAAGVRLGVRRQAGAAEKVPLGVRRAPVAQQTPESGNRRCSVQSQHFLGQKLRLGGDALGADPTYLLYLPSRPQGELRRIDLGPGCAGATWSDFAAQESTRKPLLHTRGISWA